MQKNLCLLILLGSFLVCLSACSSTLESSSGDRLMGNNGNYRVYDGNDILYGDNGSNTLDGGSGNDILYGKNGDDTLSGGSGNDYLRGGNGADVYLFGKGSGADEIRNDDDDAVGTNADTILLGEDITTANVTLTREGDNLLIRLDSTDDRLIVNAYFSEDGKSKAVVENIKFADNTIWNVATVKAKVTTKVNVATRNASANNNHLKRKVSYRNYRRSDILYGDNDDNIPQTKANNSRLSGSKASYRRNDDALSSDNGPPNSRDSSDTLNDSSDRSLDKGDDILYGDNTLNSSSEDGKASFDITAKPYDPDTYIDYARLLEAAVLESATQLNL